MSHHLQEVFEIADRISVLRDGRLEGTWKAAEITLPKLVATMVGEAVDVRTRSPRTVHAAPVLRVREVHGLSLKGVDIAAGPGEIVGLTGLAGAGHEELSAMLFGIVPTGAGQIVWKNRLFRPRHPLDARRAGIAYVPPDRRGEGLMPTQGITENLTLASLQELATAGWINQSARRLRARVWCQQFEVACSRLTQRVATLSGGNQQKVLLARWATLEPELFILNEPTRGIDVKTREAVHRWIEDLVREERCVLLITSDTQEMIRLADRCYVFRGGRVSCQLEPPRLEEHALIAAMMGG